MIFSLRSMVGSPKLRHGRSEGGQGAARRAVAVRVRSRRFARWSPMRSRIPCTAASVSRSSRAVCWLLQREWPLRHRLTHSPSRLRMAAICALRPTRVTASNHLRDALREPRPRSAQLTPALPIVEIYDRFLAQLRGSRSQSEPAASRRLQPLGTNRHGDCTLSVRVGETAPWPASLWPLSAGEGKKAFRRERYTLLRSCCPAIAAAASCMTGRLGAQIRRPTLPASTCRASSTTYSAIWLAQSPRIPRRRPSPHCILKRPLPRPRDDWRNPRNVCSGPIVLPPGQKLRDAVDLIVVAAVREGEQFRKEVAQPWGAFR